MTLCAIGFRLQRITVISQPQIKILGQGASASTYFVVAASIGGGSYQQIFFIIRTVGFTQEPGDNNCILTQVKNSYVFISVYIHLYPMHLRLYL